MNSGPGAQAGKDVAYLRITEMTLIGEARQKAGNNVL